MDPKDTSDLSELIVLAEKYPGTASWIAAAVGVLAIIAARYFMIEAANRATNARIKIIVEVSSSFISNLRAYVAIALRDREITVETRAMEQLAAMQVTEWPSASAHQFFHDYWKHGKLVLETDIKLKGRLEAGLIVTESRYKLLRKTLDELVK